jgi:hypothetical protein
MENSGFVVSRRYCGGGDFIELNFDRVERLAELSYIPVTIFCNLIIPESMFQSLSIVPAYPVFLKRCMLRERLHADHLMGETVGYLSKNI